MRIHYFLITLLCLPLFSAPLHSADPAEEAFGGLPLYFIENRGQLDDEVRYYVQGSDKTVYFTDHGITFAFMDRKGGVGRRWSMKLDFKGAAPLKEPKGKDKKETIFSYFKGEPNSWKTGIPAYGKVEYRNLWPGIDLVYSGSVNELKYEFIVKPGADPERIRIAYQGASALSVSKEGELVVDTPFGGFEDGAPVAYQVKDSKRVNVPVEFSLREAGAPLCGFRVGAYDPALPLVIDPAVVVFCGYIGGTEYEEGKGIALDGLGNVYVAGFTESPEWSFPVKAGPDLTYNGGVFGGDAFVAKVKADGSELVYCGYIGGSDDDYGWNIAVDAFGCAYVAGETKSTQQTFPVLVGPDLTYNGGDRDAFVAKVSGDGKSLLYCGYIGGVEEDNGWGIAVDAAGCAVVAAHTLSTESSLPVKKGPDLTHNGIWDTFMAKVSADGRSLLYCGFIGGDGNDFGVDVATDAAGYAYVAGWTYSKASTFPVKVGPDLSHNGGGTDVFVAKLAPDGTDFEYCGYIGGSDFDQGRTVAVDEAGRAYVAGWTQSTESSFPVKIGPDLTHNGGYSDAFIAKVSADGGSLDYCGYIGGDKGDFGEDVAVDAEGSAYVVGATYSDESTFPVSGGPTLTYGGDEDAFVAKVAMASLSSDVSTISAGSGGTVNFLLAAGGNNGNRNYLLLGSASGTIPGIPLPGGTATLPLNWDLLMQLVILYANTPVFQNFMGTLNSDGLGSAALNVGPMPGAAGLKVHFAFALNAPWDFASNPLEILVVP